MMSDNERERERIGGERTESWMPDNERERERRGKENGELDA